MDVVADASEFDELSNEEADEFAESQEELIGDVPKLEYNQFAGSALDELLSKERKLGFRKHVIEERPNFLHKLRVAIDIFLNEPTSSILVIIIFFLSSFSQVFKLFFILGKDLVVIYPIVDYCFYSFGYHSILAKFSKRRRTFCYHIFFN